MPPGMSSKFVNYNFGILQRMINMALKSQWNKLTVHRRYLHFSSQEISPILLRTIFFHHQF